MMEDSALDAMKNRWRSFYARNLSSCNENRPSGALRVAPHPPTWFCSGAFYALLQLVAFVAAMLVTVLACCLPIIVMELALGQLTGRAPVQALLSACPLFKGVGVAHILYSLVWMSYSAVWLGYVCLLIFFLFYGIAAPLPPWTGCQEYFSSGNCYDVAQPLNETAPDGTLLRWPPVMASPIPKSRASSLQDYTRYSIVKPGDGLDEPGPLGHMEWLCICGAGAVWLLVLIAVFAGVRWLGKVAYFTLFIPLLLAAALCVNVMLQPDAAVEAGKAIWLRTDWNALLQWDLWTNAFAQALYSCGLGLGAFITLGSYNKRSNNLVCDSFLIILMYLFTTTLLTCTMFAYAQHMATQSAGIYTIGDFLTLKSEGQFHFILSTMLHFAYPKVWTGILLFMIAFMIINTFYVLTLNILAAMEDALGEKSSRCFPRLLLAIVICCAGMALSLAQTTKAAPYTLELTWKFLDYFTPWFILAFELLAIAWFYCAYSLGRDVRHMVRSACCWCTGCTLLLPLYVLPAVPVYVLVRKLWMYDFTADMSAGVRQWEWAECVGWAIAVVPVLPIPLYMIYIVIKTCLRGPGESKWQRFKYTIISPLHYEIVKPASAPRYAATAPGYVLLPQAPLAQEEAYNENVYGERVVRVSNI